MIASWSCPAPALSASGGLAPAPAPAPAYAVAIDRGRPRRLLIVPALFDEANRLRRFTVEMMRRLDEAGIDSFLPDLPGCNESLVPPGIVTLADWRMAAAAAAVHFGATHALGLRGGALVLPALPGWHYAPVGGAAILRQMLRGRIMASREAGREETSEALLAHGLTSGLTLAGYELSAALIAGLQTAQPDPATAVISQSDIGGSGLWLRAEPDEDPAQSAALAGHISAAWPAPESA